MMDFVTTTIRSLAAAATWEGAIWFLIRITVILALGHLVLALVGRRAAAATRHMVAIAALGAALVIPVASLVAPAGPALVLPQSVVSAVPILARITAPTPPAPSPRLAPAPPRATLRGVKTLHPLPAPSAAPQPAPRPAVRPEAPEAPVPAMTAPPADQPPTAAWLVSGADLSDLSGIQPGVLLAWLAISITFVLLSRTVLGAAAARRLFRDAAPVTDEHVRAELERARGRLGIGRPVTMMSSHRVAVPVVVGFVRPTLFMPSAARDWSVERLRVVLIHELAHIRRHDCLTLLFVRFATALLWFHPLAWSLARIARRECERACDDVVLSGGVRASDYADHLVAIAHGVARRGPVPALALAITRGGGLEGRVLSILRAGVPRGPASRKTVAVTGCLALLMLLPVATVRVVAAPRTDAVVVHFASHGGTLPTVILDAADPEAVEAGAEAAAEARAEALEAKLQHRGLEVIERVLAAYPGTDLEDLGIEDLDDVEDLDADTGCEDGTDVSVTMSFDADVEPGTVSTTFVQAGSRHSAEWQNGADAYERAVDLYEDEKFAPAGESFEKAARAGVRKGTAWYNAACAYARAGQRKRALEALDAALEADFENIELIQEDSDLNAIRGEPGFRRIMEEVRSSSTYREAHREAVAKYEDLVAGRSDDADAWQSVGGDLLRSGEPSRSADAYERQYKIDRSANALYNRGCALAIGGDRAQALGVLERAILEGAGSGEHFAEDPDLVSLHGDRDYERLLRLVTDLTLTRNDLQIQVWGDGSTDLAEAWGRELPRLERATRDHPDVGRAWSNLGIGELRAGHPEASRKAFERALELGYRRPQTMYNLACAAAQMNQVDRAMEWLDRADRAGMPSVWGKAPWDEDLAPLHASPKFRELTRKWRNERNDHGKWRKDKDGDWSYRKLDPSKKT